MALRVRWPVEGLQFRHLNQACLLREHTVDSPASTLPISTPSHVVSGGLRIAEKVCRYVAQSNKGETKAHGRNMVLGGCSAASEPDR